MYFLKGISIENLRKIIIFVGILKVTDEKGGAGSVSQRYGSEDRDPNQNVTDPEHWRQEVICCSQEGKSVSKEHHGQTIF